MTGTDAARPSSTSVRNDGDGGDAVRLPRVAVLSRRRAGQLVWHASQFEFEDVIGEVDAVGLLTPGADRRGPLGVLTHGAMNRARRALRVPRRSVLHSLGDVVDADVFFAVFAAPHEIADLRAVQPQLERASTKVAFLIEMWNSQVARSADYLRQLRGFDHIFVFNRNVIPAVEAITGVRCSYLSHAVDTARFAPRAAAAPERWTDVVSFGRGMHDVTHRALVDALEAGRLTYLFDTINGPFEVTDYRDHRLVLAARLQRSRYAIVQKISDTTEKLGLTAGEEMLTTRYFEVVASGAVMLGTAPDLQDFTDAFDWPDALIPISVPEPRIEDVVRELDADPDRVRRARNANVVQSLRRHDWAHRWSQVLQVAGLEPLPALTERLDRLGRLADEVEQQELP